MSDDSWWTDERLKYYNLHRRGYTDVEVAQNVGVHRNTLRAWRESSEFKAKLAEDDAHELGMLQRRRTQNVTQLTSGYEQLALKAQRELVEDPKNEHKFTRSMQLARAFGAMRDRERIELGLNDANVTVKHTGAVQHGHAHVVAAVAREELGAFLSQRIDVAALPDGPPEQVLGRALLVAAGTTEVIDAIDAEDQAALPSDALQEAMRS